MCILKWLMVLCLSAAPVFAAAADAHLSPEFKPTAQDYRFDSPSHARPGPLVAHNGVFLTTFNFGQGAQFARMTAAGEQLEPPQLVNNVTFRRAATNGTEFLLLGRRATPTNGPNYVAYETVVVHISTNGVVNKVTPLGLDLQYPEIASSPNGYLVVGVRQAHIASILTSIFVTNARQVQSRRDITPDIVDAALPSVAHSENRFLVAWQQTTPPSSPNLWDVQAIIVDSSGVPLEESRKVVANSPAYDVSPLLGTRFRVLPGLFPNYRFFEGGFLLRDHKFRWRHHDSCAKN